jgi:CrcB protein
MVTLEKGSFGGQALESPQLTMESVDSGTDLELSPRRRVLVSDGDENDAVFVDSNPALGMPISSRSLSSSTQSRDQVLDLSAQLDITDSSAIISRLNNNNNNKQMSPDNGKATRRSSSPLGNPTPRVSGGRTLARRPSMHETHDDDCLNRAEFLYYLYSFAIVGTSLRVFMARLFGQDCDHPGVVSDFLSPLSEKICVTATGETIQRGGALFIDLPANMLGCFIMGLVSSLNPEHGRPGGKLPWLRNDHPLQHHEGLHHAIKVGFCGSLTTFSSWNTQMVQMMDGSDTVLGPQVVPAIFGYIIGLMTATGSFILGGRVYEWFYNWSNGIKDEPSDLRRRYRSDEEDPDEEDHPTSFDSEETHKSRHSLSKSSAAAHEAPRSQRFSPPTSSSSLEAARKRQQRSQAFTILAYKVVPFFIAISLLVLYGVADGVTNSQFYRELWFSSLLTPIGVHLRWKLATLNGRGFGPNHRFEWMPWGTLAGNLAAVVLSVLFQALITEFLQTGRKDTYPWMVAIAVGMKTGLAGSLSTVSSMVKEIVSLYTIHPTHAKAYIYGAGTIVLSMVLGLAVYSPMMRHG